MTLTNEQKGFLWKKCWPVKTLFIAVIFSISVFLTASMVAIILMVSHPGRSTQAGILVFVFLLIFGFLVVYSERLNAKPKYRIPLLWVQCNKDINDYPVDATEYGWWRSLFENNLAFLATYFLMLCCKQEAWDRLIKEAKQAREQFETSAQIKETSLPDLRKIRNQWILALYEYTILRTFVSNAIKTAKINLEREWELAELFGVAPSKDLKTFLEKKIKPEINLSGEIEKRIIEEAKSIADKANLDLSKVLIDIEPVAS